MTTVYDNISLKLQYSLKYGDNKAISPRQLHKKFQESDAPPSTISITLLDGPDIPKLNICYVEKPNENSVAASLLHVKTETKHSWCPVGISISSYCLQWLLSWISIYLIMEIASFYVCACEQIRVTFEHWSYIQESIVLCNGLDPFQALFHIRSCCPETLSTAIS